MPELNNNPESLQTVAEDDGLMQLPEELIAFFNKNTLWGEEYITNTWLEKTPVFDHNNLSKAERAVLISYYNEKTPDETYLDIYEKFKAWEKYAHANNDSLADIFVRSSMLWLNEEKVLVELIRNRCGGDFETFVASVIDSQEMDAGTSERFASRFGELMAQYKENNPAKYAEEEGEEEKWEKKWPVMLAEK